MAHLDVSSNNATKGEAACIWRKGWRPSSFLVVIQRLAGDVAAAIGRAKLDASDAARPLQRDLAELSSAIGKERDWRRSILLKPWKSAALLAGAVT